MSLIVWHFLVNQVKHMHLLASLCLHTFFFYQSRRKLRIWGQSARNTNQEFLTSFLTQVSAMHHCTLRMTGEECWFEKVVMGFSFLFWGDFPPSTHRLFPWQKVLSAVHSLFITRTGRLTSCLRAAEGDACDDGAHAGPGRQVCVHTCTCVLRERHKEPLFYFSSCLVKLRWDRLVEWLNLLSGENTVVIDFELKAVCLHCCGKLWCEKELLSNILSSAVSLWDFTAWWTWPVKSFLTRPK